VDKEGPQNGGNEEGSPPSSNVVRLPRDWLGPRDELIPLGPLDEGQTDVHRDSDSGSTSAPSPPSAEDFWGEGSAEVQDALQRPAVRAVPLDTGAGARPGPNRVRRRIPRLRRQLSWRRWSERPASRTGGSPARTVAIGAIRSRRRGVAVAALAAVLCVALVVRILDMSGDSRLVSSKGGAATHRTLPIDAWKLPAIRPLTSRVHRQMRRQMRTRHAVRAHRSQRKQTNVVEQANPSYVTPATYTPPPSQSASPGSVSGPGTGSGGGGAPAGPVGAGAPFGPGHLG
jgi:hypothetical protein